MEELALRTDALKARDLELRELIKGEKNVRPADRDNVKIKTWEKELKDIRASIEQCESLPSAWQDALDLTAPIADDTPELWRITTHRRISGEGQAPARTAAPLAHYRVFEVAVKGTFEARVCDLASYGERVYAMKDWLEMVERELPGGKMAAEKHLRSHATIKSARCCPGERRLIYWGPAGLTLNLWRGYTCMERPWGRESGLGYCGEMAVWLHTVFTRICSNDHALFMRFMSFMAFLFQRPNEKAGLALMLCSRTQGAGKNAVLSGVDAVLGEHSRVEGTDRRLIKESNAWLLGKRLVIVDESVGSRRVSQEETMALVNSLITEPEAHVRKLYSEPQYDKMRAMFVFCSNRPDAGLDMKNNPRRLQFMSVIEKRLAGPIGKSLKEPRNPDFHRQLLHLLSTIRFKDSLHDVIDTASAHRAARDQLMERFPILRGVYAIAAGTIDDCMHSMLGLHHHADNCQIKSTWEYDISRSKEQNDEDKRGALAAICRQRDEIRRLGIERGWFTMPRATAMTRITVLCFGSKDGRLDGNMAGVSRVLDDFTLRMSTYPDDELRKIGVTPETRTEMGMIRTGEVIMPVSPDGFKFMLTLATHKSWEDLHNIFRLDVENELNGNVLLPVTDAQVQAIAAEAERLDDTMWEDVSNCIRHAELNRQRRTGVFAEYFDDDMPLLLSVEELTGRDGQPGSASAGAWDLRARAATILRQCEVDAEAEVTVADILDAVLALPEDITDPAMAICTAMNSVCPLPEGGNLRQIMAHVFENDYQYETVNKIARHQALVIPELPPQLEENGGHWAIVAHNEFLMRRLRASHRGSAADLRRQLSELLGAFPALMSVVAVLSHGSPMPNAIDAVAAFLEDAIELTVPITVSQAEALLVGDSFNVLASEVVASQHVMVQDVSRFKTMLREVWEFCHAAFAARMCPTEYGDDSDYEYTKWGTLFNLWQRRLH